MKKKIAILVALIVISLCFSGCTVQEADKVNHNMSVAADNFNLNDYTLYVVEDITGTHADPYHYIIEFHTTFPVEIDVKP